MDVHAGQTMITLFSYPEYSSERQKIEPKIIDPSHLLTNNRTRMLTKGMKGVKPAAFHNVCTTHPSVINRAVMIDLIDKQNVAYALRVFSSQVEKALLENGDTAEAQYTKLIREWYEAIDTPGLTAQQRVKQLLAFRNYLLKDVNFATFPPPGLFIKGLPIVQFCGFIQNVETRLMLYGTTKQNTYNHRVIGTLAVESFFGDLTEMDPTGCPKATKIPRLMSHVTEINNFRHDSESRYVQSFEYKWLTCAVKPMSENHLGCGPNQSIMTIFCLT